MDIRIDLNLAAQVRQFQQWGVQGVVSENGK